MAFRLMINVLEVGVAGHGNVIGTNEKNITSSNRSDGAECTLDLMVLQPLGILFGDGSRMP